MHHLAVRNNREDEDRPATEEQASATGFETLPEEEAEAGGHNVEGDESLSDLELAVTKIQALERGRRGRASVNELKQDRAAKDRDAAGAVGSNAANAELAATKIQAMERGRRGRASANELKQGLAAEDRGPAGVGSTEADGIEAGASNPRFLGFLGVLLSRCFLLVHI